MPHIDIPEGLPGIRGPLSIHPDVAKPLSGLMEILMRSDNSLTRGERELIAAYVSYLNDCMFCDFAHSSVAQYYLQCHPEFVEQVKKNFNSTLLSDKMKSLLSIAASVQRGGNHVSPEQIQRAKEVGVTDIEIHDTVLIAASFCMFNRYTDGLDTWAPNEAAFYINRAPDIAEKGYTLY